MNSNYLNKYTRLLTWPSIQGHFLLYDSFEVSYPGMICPCAFIYYFICKAVDGRYSGAVEWDNEAMSLRRSLAQTLQPVWSFIYRICMFSPCVCLLVLCFYSHCPKTRTFRWIGSFALPPVAPWEYFLCLVLCVPE